MSCVSVMGRTVEAPEKQWGIQFIVKIIFRLKNVRKNDHA